MFAPDNDQVFEPLVRSQRSKSQFERIAPEEWVKRGEKPMRELLVGPMAV